MKKAQYKILFITPSLGAGGAERVLVSLANGLEPDQFSPEIIMFSSDNAFKKELPSSIPVYSLDRGFLLVTKLSLPWQLCQLFLTKKPDLICAHQTYANWISIFAWALANKPCPILITEHNLPTYTIRVTPRSSLQRWLLKKSYPYANKIISVCKTAKKDLVANFGIKANQITVIYNGIDQERVKRLAKAKVVISKINPHHPLIVTVGRFTAQKNQRLLLHALITVKEEIPEARLLIVGDGEKRAELKQLTSQLGLSESVRFLGFKQNPFPFTRQSDLFVLPSAWEGFPLILLEAMACHTPVLASKCPSGISELINHGKNGWLVPPDNSQIMARAIIKLLKDRPLRKRLADQAECDVKQYSVAAMVKAYENLFLASI